MYVLTLKWNRKTAVAIVVAAALLLAGLVLLAGRSRPEIDETALGIRLDSTEKRIAYLASLGWEVRVGSESVQEILIPREFGEVYEKYNALQRSQDFDLSEYKGMDAKLYTYALEHHPSGEEAMVQLILAAGEVIGGDVHSTALGGFMHGIRPTPD